jgi:hypothetical protein
VTLTSTGSPAGAAVGTYPIVASGATGSGLSNYTISYTDGKLKVTGATPACTVSGYTATYDGSAHAVTSGSCTDIDGKTLDGTFDFSGTSHTAAGTYTGDAWTFTPTDTNYSSTGDTVTDVITKAAITITATDQTKTYGTSADLGTTAFDVSSGLAAGDHVTGVTLTSTGSPAGAAVGTYPIVASGATGSGLSNYTISYTDGKLTVTKADAVCTVTPYNVGYDGNGHTAIGGCVGVNKEDLAGLNLGSTTHTPAGTYATDAWSFTDSTGNYNNTSGTVSDSITKVNATCTVTPYNVGFDGNAHTATGSCVGAKGEALTGLILDGTTHTAVGTYATDPWTFTDSTGNYNNNSGTVSDSIGKLPQSITFNNPGDQKVDVAPFDLGATASSHLTVTYTVNKVLGVSSSCTVTGSIVTITGAGFCSVTASQAGDATYNPAPKVTQTFFITKYPQKITFNALPDVVYGVAPITLTAASDSGLPITYIALGKCTVSGNTLTITGVGICTVTATQPGNWKYRLATPVPNIFAITKGAITITANDLPKTYGTALSFAGTEFTVTTGSYAAGDITQVTLTSTGAAAVAGVGTYPIVITPGSATGPGAANYTITYVNGTLTVGPKYLTITAKSKSKAFSQAVTLDGTSDFTASGLANGDGIDSVTLTCTGLAAKSAVADYPIVVTAPVPHSGTDLNNYTIHLVNGTLHIVDKPTLTITASNQSKVYGTAATLGTTAFTVEGYSDAAAVHGSAGPAAIGDVVVSVELTSVGAPASAGVVGTTYPIVITPGSATGPGVDNYFIVYVDGTLSVTKADLNVTANDRTKTVGTTLNLGHTLFTTTGLVNGDKVTSVDLASTGAASGAAVGPYDISADNATGTGLANYNVAYHNGTLTVTDKLTITITADNVGWTYGDAEPPLTYQIEGFASGDTEGNSLTGTITCTTADTTGAKPGDTFQITCTGAASEKYTINYDPGTLTITGQIVDPATGKPRHTPARTSTGGGQNSDNSVPLFAFLICIAFGGLGLLAVQAQRKSMRS